MNLLPGLRELRAPLVSGYLWLLSLWLGLGHLGWLPTRRPPGNSEVARLWDLGGALGKTVVLAAASFIAYLIGSFLEIEPDGRLARLLAPRILFDRKPLYFERSTGYTRLVQTFKYRFPRFISGGNIVWMYGNSRPTDVDYETAKTLESAEEELYKRNWARIHEARDRAKAVARFLSREARLDLMDLLSQRQLLPSASKSTRSVRVVSGIVDRGSNMSEPKLIYDREAPKAAMVGDEIVYEIIREMPQLASRLLVKNKDLYSKYDRHMAEAAVRMNVSIPLTVLLVEAIWLSDLPIWSEALITIIAVTLGFMLMRQGFLRTVAARDVIAQALTIDEIQSRYIPTQKPPPGRAEESDGSEKPELAVE